MRHSKGLRTRRILVVLLACFCVLSIMPEKVAAAQTGQETVIPLFGEHTDTRVGRYKINYIGNTNHYTWYSPNGGAIDKKIYNDLSGYANSSVATLECSTDTSQIKYAYLVWQTRAKQGVTRSVGLITPSGGKYSISPEYAINDWRVVGNNPGMRSMFCMATDVTEIVKSSGYGEYAVCNIPYFNWGDDGDRGGGESPGSWQLIVVEEDDSFPVRAVSLDMGAKFYLGKDFGSELSLGNGLKSKSAGTATGQVFFGASNSSTYEAMTENIETYNERGDVIGKVASNTTTSAGLYKNGNLVNDRDRLYGCIRMDLSNIDSNMGNNANRINLTVQNTGWTTSFLLGMAVDIAYPDFAGTQTTTVHSASSATVEGEFRNVAVTNDTGIYDGNMTVQLDSGLTPISATAVVNGSTQIQGTINGNTVTFSGSEVSSMMNGSTISYTVQCQANNGGKTVFENSAGFHGYLRSDGTNTGYWIERMWTAESKAVPKYTLVVQGGDGIESVTGGGDHPYGSDVNIGATVKPGYHWKGWTGSYNTAEKDYGFQMPNQDITMRAEAEANAYTITFDPNGGGEVKHIDDIATQYDKQVSLPDGAANYVKYTQEGVNVTDAVLSGALSLSAETEKGEQSEVGESDNGAMSEGEPQQPEENHTAGENPPSNEEMEQENGTEQLNKEGEVAPQQDPTEQEETVQGNDNDPQASVEETNLPVTQEGEGDVAEQSNAEAVSEQSEAPPKVYPSVFLGWSLEAGKDSLTPQWKAGEVVDVKTLAEAAGVTSQNGAVIPLYAIWDDCPWIQATDLYYTLEQAQSGFITDMEILSHATASDREDGSPILPGFHENGTSFSIPDYSPTDFTQFQSSGSCTENLTVVDSVGSVYKKQITVHVVDTTPQAVEPKGSTRFINEYYYNQPYENGGLEDDSLWKTDPAYVEAIQKAFNNLKNDTPIQTYRFTHEDILEMKEFTRVHGIGNSKEPDALQKFYDQFMKPNLQ